MTKKVCVQQRLDAVINTADARERLPLLRPIHISGPPGCGKTFLMLHCMRYLNTSREPENN